MHKQGSIGIIRGMNPEAHIPRDTRGLSIYFVGIKGTGMSALAELMLRGGAAVTGSDTTERFYTDEVLQSLKIPYIEGFKAENIPSDVDFIVHSAAYSPETHPELLEAKRRGIPIIEYTQALGDLSRGIHATGVAGVHGKTTTTALIGTIVKDLGLPGSVLVGSAVKGFHNRATYYNGDRFFVAETCEYRRHFLSFHPDQLVITTVDVDHLDYFRDYADIESAFMEYARKLPSGGWLVYCSDDPGAVDLSLAVKRERPDIRLVPYGTTADGMFRIVESSLEAGRQRMRLAGWDRDLFLKVPGHHTLLNAAGAVAAAAGLYKELHKELGDEEFQQIAVSLEGFSGSKRRSELLGMAGGVLFVDDYGHHPREIRTTLQGFRQFYPDRRIIIDFMSHTYTRTQALLDDFATAFADADVVILHKIYASARETSALVDGRTLYSRVREHHPQVYYFQEVDEAAGFLLEFFREGDLFITMGAGENWRLGAQLYHDMSGEEKDD